MPNLELLEEAVKNVMSWCDPKRPDFALHVAEAVLQLYARASGEEAAYHEAGKYWNASSGQYDTDGCW